MLTNQISGKLVSVLCYAAANDDLIIGFYTSKQQQQP